MKRHFSLLLCLLIVVLALCGCEETPTTAPSTIPTQTTTEPTTHPTEPELTESDDTDDDELPLVPAGN